MGRRNMSCGSIVGEMVSVVTVVAMQLVSILMTNKLFRNSKVEWLMNFYDEVGCTIKQGDVSVKEWRERKMTNIFTGRIVADSVDNF